MSRLASRSRLVRSVRLFKSRSASLGLVPLGLAFLSVPSFAQDAAVSPPPAVGQSPEAAPSPVEATAATSPPATSATETATAPADLSVTVPISVPSAATSSPAPTLLPTEPTPVATSAPMPEKVRRVSSGRDLPAPAALPSHLYAPNISYVGNMVMADGTAENPVRFVTSSGNLTALHVQIDTIAQVVEATGNVHFERQQVVQHRELRASTLPKLTKQETVTETLVGQNLHYDIKSQTGKLDDAHLQLDSLQVSTASLVINGKRYTGQNVIIRPGALSPEESKIYGTPPLNIRAKSISALMGTSTKGTPGQNTVATKGAELYFRSTKLIPLPGYVFRSALGGGSNDPQAFKATPGISFNSADRILVTTRLSYPLTKNPQGLTTFADIGLSQRIGLRGGVGLTTHEKIGEFTLRERHNDIVETQLTNRIELDRKPELTYQSPAFGTFRIGKLQEAGFTIQSSYGNYSERHIGDDEASVNASRFYNRLLFTTRVRAIDGPYMRLFATSSRYSGDASHYDSKGYEVGYDGKLLPRVRGQISLRATSLEGNTPFRFDKIEISRELRSTFDIELTPRFLLPVDLRYDLSEHRLRDETFGLLRSYKTFAYGIVYQQARQDLRLEVREGF